MQLVFAVLTALTVNRYIDHVYPKFRDVGCRSFISKESRAALQSAARSQRSAVGEYKGSTGGESRRRTGRGPGATERSSGRRGEQRFRLLVLGGGTQHNRSQIWWPPTLPQLPTLSFTSFKNTVYVDLLPPRLSLFRWLLGLSHTCVQKC